MSHSYFEVLDKHERAWRHGRGSRWFGTDGDRLRGRIGLEYVHLPDRVLRRLRLKVSTTGEETLDVAYGCPLFSHYWSLDAYQRDGRTMVRLPGIRFVIELGITGVGWCFGSDDGHWRRHERLIEKLRRNDLTWWRVSRYRYSHETVETVPVVVALPEGPYDAEATLERNVWGILVGPYRLTRESKRWLRFFLPGFKRTEYSATIDTPGGFPVPGKGENPYDCDPDHINSLSTAVSGPERGKEWIGQIVAKLQDSVYRTRTRYGSGITDTGR